VLLGYPTFIPRRAGRFVALALLQQSIQRSRACD
jgi:hypothetical protein